MNLSLSVIQMNKSSLRPRGFRWYFSLAVALLLNGVASAQTGVTNNAPDIDYYVGLTESCCGEDPHPVHGIGTVDGGVIIVGKTVTANDGWGGFAVKLGQVSTGSIGQYLTPNESPALAWSTTIGGPRTKSVLLSSVADESSVFLAGMRADSSGRVSMYLAKHALANGTKIWEKQLSSPYSSGNSAIEAVALTPDGGLVAVGVVDCPQNALEGFKSFGNPVGGRAHIFYLSPDQVSSPTAPTSPVWTRSFEAYQTVKSVRPLPGENEGFIALAGSEDESPSLLRLDASGEPIWARSYPGRFEATDVALHMIDGQHLGYTFTGHGGEDGTLDGQITRVDLDGNELWARSFGNPAGGIGVFENLGAGHPQLIFDECWGIQGLADGGAIVACGTGIEGCDLVGSYSTLQAECANDPRRVWRGYVIRFDAQGQILWHRVDSFSDNGESDVSDSASEYVALLPNGGFLSVVDQGFGIGALALAPEGEQARDGATVGLPTPLAESSDETDDANLETDDEHEPVEDGPDETVDTADPRDEAVPDIEQDFDNGPDHLADADDHPEPSEEDEAFASQVPDENLIDETASQSEVDTTAYSSAEYGPSGTGGCDVTDQAAAGPVGMVWLVCLGVGLIRRHRGVVK